MNDAKQDIWRRGQFVLGPRPLERLASWNRHQAGPALHLAAHPAFDVMQAPGEGFSIMLPGSIVNTLRGLITAMHARCVIARFWPECLELPINPKPPMSLVKRVRRLARRILNKLSK